MSDRPSQVQESGTRCRHLWQPYADADRIWQACDKCGLEEHIVTHEQHLADTLAYIFREGPDA